MKDILYIKKELGINASLFFIYFKIKLKIRYIPFVKQIRKGNEKQIEEIYDALYLMNASFTLPNGRRFIEKVLLNLNNAKIYLRPYGSDVKVFEQVFINKQYQCVVDIFNQFFSEAPLQIFDCGANIGLTTIYLNIHYPNAFYTVIEPFKDNIESIKLNFNSIKINKFKLIEGGVWNSNTALSIDKSFGDGKEWAISLIESNHKTNEVLVYSLAKLIEEREALIDILKIDIEGAEKALFKNELYAASFLLHVKCIAIEIHDEGTLRENIYKTLSCNNFFYFNSGELTIGVNRRYI